nr:hypothetical protein [Tanacetum cinerariifolium]
MFDVLQFKTPSPPGDIAGSSGVTKFVKNTEIIEEVNFTHESENITNNEVDDSSDNDVDDSSDDDGDEDDDEIIEEVNFTHESENITNNEVDDSSDDDVDDSSDDDGDEDDDGSELQPGEASIRKKIWNFLST